MTKPLTGITVVSIEQAVAAPLCTCRLADAGARVIKIERPDGDFARGYDAVVRGESAWFVWINRGKESVMLDLKQTADRDLVLRMLDRADVFVQNLAPGAADRLGLGSAGLRERYSRLVTCDISGYGDGPYRDMKAYDFLVQCESGIVSVSGAPGHPGRVGVSICDIDAGLNAAQGITSALLHRERTGEATGVTVSLFDTAAELMSVPLMFYDHGGTEIGAVGMRHPTIQPYGAYRAGDGREFAIAVQNDREWARLATEVLGQPELGTDERFATNNARVANIDAMNEAIDAAFGTMDLETLRAKLGAAGIAYGAINGVAGLARHPQLRRWPMTVAGEAIAYAAPPIQTPFDEGAYSPVPDLGQHTAAIRAEFA